MERSLTRVPFKPCLWVKLFIYLNWEGWEICISTLTNDYSHSLKIFDGNGLFSVQLVLYIQKLFTEGGSNHITVHVEPRGSRTVLVFYY